MQWKLVKAFDEVLKEYHLIENDKILIVLKYNSLQQSVRISSKGEYLSFFMERTGFAATRIVFKNGYGVEVGKCTFNRRHDKGLIEYDGTLYNYELSGAASIKAVLYNLHDHQPAIACDWPLNAPQIITLFKQGWYEEYASLLLGLHCYVNLFHITATNSQLTH
jgi:hypothetical protein